MSICFFFVVVFLFFFCFFCFVCVCVCVCTGTFKRVFQYQLYFLKYITLFVCVCFHIGCSAGRINHSIYYSFDNCTGYLPTLGLCLNKDLSI